MPNHKQVAHLWANKSRPRSAGHNMFFEGDTIYSYGHHFAIATHTHNTAGDPAIIFTRRDYSISTAKHKSQVLRSIPEDVPVFFGDPTRLDKPALRASVRLYVADALELKAKALRSTRYAAHTANQATLTLDKAREMNTFFRLGMRHGIPEAPFFTDEEQAKIGELQRKADEFHSTLRQRQAAARVRREEAQRIKDAELFVRWKNGEVGYCPHSYSADEKGSAYVRLIERDGGTLQTSQGAEVPLEDGRRLFRFVKLCRMMGRDWHHNGTEIPVGGFKVRSIDHKGNVKIGCHYLSWERIEEVAKAAGFFEDPATAEVMVSNVNA